MKARIEPFQDGLGEVRYRVIAETASWSAACRAKLEVEAVNERAFVSFDPPEEPRWPSDATAIEYAPQGVSANYASGAVMPPNCNGNAQYGQEPTQVGQLIAQAGFTAAESDSECSTVGCVIPQVKDNGSD